MNDYTNLSKDDLIRLAESVNVDMPIEELRAIAEAIVLRIVNE